MISSGLYQIDNGGQSLRLLKNRIACFDGELLRELSWGVFSNNDNEVSSDIVSVKIANYLLRHKACLQSSTKDVCNFYYDSEGPFARQWSDNQFRIVHEEFQTLYAALAGGSDHRPVESLTDDRIYNILRLFFSKPLLERLPIHSNIRITMQYSGQSQVAGTRMMQFVEERILDLTEGECRSRGVVCFYHSRVGDYVHLSDFLSNTCVHPLMFHSIRDLYRRYTSPTLACKAGGCARKGE